MPADSRYLQRVCGCDTFIAYPPVAPEGMAIFGKNSDRPAGEKQSVQIYPSSTAGYSSPDSLSCTYIEIAQASVAYSVLLSKIDWMWGAEMGANEYGVVIGNEAVWTKEPIEDSGLLGMDLVRLGLERARSSFEALHVITELLEKHGQGGACAEDDPSFTYHNSFLMADYKEAWILETAGRHWVAERVTRGARNISNCLTIRTSIDLASTRIKDYAKSVGYWDGNEPFDFAKSFSADEVLSASRLICGRNLLTKHTDGTLTVEEMIKILRDHHGGICMHGSFETTASMVSQLKSNGQYEHFMTGKPYPCKNEFLPYSL